MFYWAVVSTGLPNDFSLVALFVFAGAFTPLFWLNWTDKSSAKQNYLIGFRQLDFHTPVTWLKHAKERLQTLLTVSDNLFVTTRRARVVQCHNINNYCGCGMSEYQSRFSSFHSFCCSRHWVERSVATRMRDMLTMRLIERRESEHL